MDPEEFEDILDEQQAYIERMNELREDLEFDIAQHGIDRDIEKSYLEHKAKGREIEAKRQQLQGDDALEREIEHRRQKILDMLRISDPPPLLLPPFLKENWIKRLSSENWRSELERLRTEIAAFQVSLNQVKSLSTLEDKLKDLDFMVSHPGIRLIDPEDE